MIAHVVTISVRTTITTGKVVAAMAKKTARVLSETAAYTSKVLQAGVHTASRAARAVGRAKRAAYQFVFRGGFTRAGHRLIAPTRHLSDLARSSRRLARTRALRASPLRFIVTPVVVSYKTLRVLFLISPLDDLGFLFLGLVFGIKRAKEVEQDAGVVRRGEVRFNTNRGEVHFFKSESATDKAMRYARIDFARRMATVPFI